jgi:hypothetical protein
MPRRHIAAALLTVCAAGTSPALAQTGGVAAPPATQPASVTLVRVVYDAAGTTPSVAMANRREDFTGYFYSTDSLCTIGRDSTTRPADATFGWEVTGHFASRTPSEVLLQLTWTRVWDEGRVVSAPSGSLTLALHPGDRIPVDRISTSAVPGKCTGVGMTLSVEFSGASVPNGLSVSGVGRAGGIANVPSRGGGVGGGGGGFVAGGGIANVPRPVQSPSGGVSLGGGRGGAGLSSDRAGASFVDQFGGRVDVGSDLDPQTLQTVGVELWLVDRAPDGTEQSQFQTVRTVPRNGAFTFAPVLVSGSGASFSVEVKGYVQAQRTTDGVENLEIGLLRRVNLLVGSLPMVQQQSAGASNRIVRLPKPEEVLSFEMPSSRATNEPVGGHLFSVRLRVVR